MHAQGKETLLLTLAAIAPFYTMTIWYSALNDYRKRKRCHQDPRWGREHMPWHVDHHLGCNQDANWCVANPFSDHVMGTRELGEPSCEGDVTLS